MPGGVECLVAGRRQDELAEQINHSGHPGDDPEEESDREERGSQGGEERTDCSAEKENVDAGPLQEAFGQDDPVIGERFGEIRLGDESRDLVVVINSIGHDRA